MNYRKIYLHHYGSIPLDEEGRRFHIHHIDGNRKNNNIDNLIALSIKDHYNLHYQQGDWAACLKLAARMREPPHTKSFLASKANQSRIDAGTHIFLDKEYARQRNLDRVKNGTHNLLKREDGSSQSSDRVKQGLHHFVTQNPIHNLLKSGNHASKIKLSCIFCKKTTSKNQFNKFHAGCGRM